MKHQVGQWLQWAPLTQKKRVKGRRGVAYTYLPICPLCSISMSYANFLTLKGNYPFDFSSLIIIVSPRKIYVSFIPFADDPMLLSEHQWPHNLIFDCKESQWAATWPHVQASYIIMPSTLSSIICLGTDIALFLCPELAGSSMRKQIHKVVWVLLCPSEDLTVPYSDCS